MMGEAVYGNTNGRTALVADRWCGYVGHGSNQQIISMLAPGGLKMGHSGLQACALGYATRHQIPN